MMVLGMVLQLKKKNRLNLAVETPNPLLAAAAATGNNGGGDNWVCIWFKDFSSDAHYLGTNWYQDHINDEEGFVRFTDDAHEELYGPSSGVICLCGKRSYAFERSDILMGERYLLKITYPFKVYL
ncbi:hypothetical protein C5167_049734 [Papaver somniferum]|uniref:Uncharacterized protein n=1 Tax=Papaver somniferum TaxID=3469 RepID=A0A4Y7KLM5_PAPSO|nr:hypothetical protein C5167_049734 [Papaver somniferum]